MTPAMEPALPEKVPASGGGPDRLIRADPAEWPVAPGWRPVTDAFFASETGQKLLGFLRNRLAAGAVIFPPQPLRALELTPPEQVRVVILGQDPYHGRGQAEGLAGVAGRDEKRTESLHDLAEAWLADGGNVVPDRSLIQGRVRHPRHESGRRVGFPLNVSHGS